jgi:hypothetical protein
MSHNLVLKMLEEHKAMILQKHTRAWLARRRLQNIRRFVLNIQLTYRVQRLQKRLEDQVGTRMLPQHLLSPTDLLYLHRILSYAVMAYTLLGFVMHICNPSPWEAETGES